MVLGLLLKMPLLSRVIASDISATLKFWAVVGLSFLTSAVLLGVERVVGIGWDFHPDSMTYATLSEEVSQSIFDNWIELLNNGFYVIVYALGQSVFLTTLMNMLLFSISNGLIYKTVKEESLYPVSDVLMLLLLLNPYRMHLSTTMLKDTLIIFFMIQMVRATPATQIFSFVSMVILRIASPVYPILFMSRRLIVYAVLAGMALAVFNWDFVIGRIIEFNDQEMQLRDFDRIPTFQEYGYPGALIRGVVWGFLSFSGLFVLISPAPAFFPVAMGSVMTLFFLKKVTHSYKVPFSLLMATAVFGVMVTGFTAYIRYIYPLLVAWPLIALVKND